MVAKYLCEFIQAKRRVKISRRHSYSQTQGVGVVDEGRFQGANPVNYTN